MIVTGKLEEILPFVSSNSIDSLVTDPPSGIEFMGLEWDKSFGGRDAWIAHYQKLFAECLPVLKPGAHGVVWALPRTSHWTATALENAGFKIKDKLAHVFGTGMPKGGKRGLYLKPGHEDWILVQKPFKGTLGAITKEFGTGCLSIGACRVEYESPSDFEKLDAGVKAIQSRGGVMGNSWSNASDLSKASDASPLGRWPANFVLSHCDECADEACDELCPVKDMNNQSGERPGMSGGGKHKPGYNGSMFGGTDCDTTSRADSGGASRFFTTFKYCAKPSAGEKEAGCEALPVKTASELVGRRAGSAGIDNPMAGAGRTSNGRHNSHPTVKSIELMRWLCRLVTPVGGKVLDPFCGSGTTGCAAVLEGFEFLGIEQDEAYAEIALARIDHWSEVNHEVGN